MNAKDLKAMIEKGLTVVPKKSSVPALRRLYFRVDENGVVTAWGSDFDQYAEIRGEASDASVGEIGVSVDDLKLIAKMQGEVTIEQVGEGDQCRANVRVGQKNITISAWEKDAVSPPEMEETATEIFSASEAWFWETVSMLKKFTSEHHVNETTHAFHFNVKKKRVEALDGVQVGIRSMEGLNVNPDAENVLLHNMCVPVLRKVMNKKSSEAVTISGDQKFIRVEGKSFTYIARQVTGKYLDVDKTLSINIGFDFSVDREEMLSVMRYDRDLMKEVKSPIPVVLLSNGEGVYAYFKVSENESLDFVATKENTLRPDLHIAFNPKLLANVLETIDTDKPLFSGSGALSPMIISGKEYTFIVLPFRIDDPSYKSRMADCIERSKAA
ncbi:MAG: hypothetical protein NC084_06410 [Bacteroides sp.]|nr:hypothetical protein [Bacteroides sp.]